MSGSKLLTSESNQLLNGRKIDVDLLHAPISLLAGKLIKSCGLYLMAISQDCLAAHEQVEKRFTDRMDRIEESHQTALGQVFTELRSIRKDLDNRLPLWISVVFGILMATIGGMFTLLVKLLFAG